MVITETHLFDVWLPPDKPLLMLLILFGELSSGGGCWMPHTSGLIAGHTAAFVEGHLELNSSVSVRFLSLLSAYWKGVENLVSMGKQAWIALLHLYLLSLHFFASLCSPTLKQPVQICLSPPDGTIKLLLAEDLLSPSQTHPVIPFGWGFRKLYTLDVLKLSWSPINCKGTRWMTAFMLCFLSHCRSNIFPPTSNERNGLGLSRETILAACIWDRCFYEDIFCMSSVTPW